MIPLLNNSTLILFFFYFFNFPALQKPSFQSCCMRHSLRNMLVSLFLRFLKFYLCMKAKIKSSIPEPLRSVVSFCPIHLPAPNHFCTDLCFLIISLTFTKSHYKEQLVEKHHSTYFKVALNFIFSYTTYAPYSSKTFNDKFIL